MSTGRADGTIGLGPGTRANPSSTAFINFRVPPNPWASRIPDADVLLRLFAVVVAGRPRRDKMSFVRPA